jgi:hypothetical protein
LNLVKVEEVEARVVHVLEEVKEAKQQFDALKSECRLLIQQLKKTKVERSRSNPELVGKINLRAILGELKSND